jgi:hypothetical protein
MGRRATNKERKLGDGREKVSAPEELAPPFKKPDITKSFQSK